MSENIQTNPEGGPTMTWLSKSTAQVGDSILIVGTDLLETSAVKINGASAEFQVLDKALVRAVVPAEAQETGNIQLTTPQGSFTLGLAFTVVVPG